MKATQEQITEWKAKYGFVFKLNAENGMVCYIRDPLSDIKVMKMAFAAISKSSVAFVQTILNNCFLMGDEAMKTIESIQVGLVDQINEITEMPHFEVIELPDNKFRIEVEGFEIVVNKVLRDDITMAEQKNPTREAFKTNENLLEKAVETDLTGIKKNSRAYIGLLTAMDMVKDKTVVSVEKL